MNCAWYDLQFDCVQAGIVHAVVDAITSRHYFCMSSAYVLKISAPTKSNTLAGYITQNIRDYSSNFMSVEVLGDLFL